MSESKVVSLNGGPVICDGQPRQGVIDVLRGTLEMAEAGEIVGVALSMLHRDGLGNWRVSGMIGGYAMIGALRCAEAELLKAARDE